MVVNWWELNINKGKGGKRVKNNSFKIIEAAKTGRKKSIQSLL